MWFPYFFSFSSWSQRCLFYSTWNCNFELYSRIWGIKKALLKFIKLWNYLYADIFSNFQYESLKGRSCINKNEYIYWLKIRHVGPGPMTSLQMALVSTKCLREGFLSSLLLDLCSSLFGAFCKGQFCSSGSITLENVLLWESYDSKNRFRYVAVMRHSNLFRSLDSSLTNLDFYVISTSYDI